MIKKILMIVAVALPLLMMGAVEASQLTGKWVSKSVELPMPDSSLKQTMTLTYNIGDDQSVAEETHITMILNDGSGTFINIDMYVDRSGKYDIDGDTIKINYDPSSVKMEFAKDDIRIKGISDPDQADMVSEMIYNEMSPMMEGLKDEICGDNEPECLSDVSILDKKMTCKLDNEITLTFSRKK